METALYNFPSSYVYPIPYIAEHDTWPDNMPLAWDNSETDDELDEEDESNGFMNTLFGNGESRKAQRDDKLLKWPNTERLIHRIKFVKKVNEYDDPDRADPETKDSYVHFLNEFPKILARLLPEDLITQGAEIPVIVVSHSGYMRDQLKCLGSKKKPKNNEVWMKEYIADLIKPHDIPHEYRLLSRRSMQFPPMRDASEECGPPLFDTKSYPTYKGEKASKLSFGRKPCEYDVSRCSQENMFMP